MGIVAWFVFDFLLELVSGAVSVFQNILFSLVHFFMEFICNYVFIACHEFFPSLLILNLLPYQLEYTKVWKVDMTLDYIIFYLKMVIKMLAIFGSFMINLESFLAVT